MGTSSRAVGVVDVNRRLVGQSLWGELEHSTYVFPTTAVDPVADRLQRVPLNGNTIERSDLSLTCNPRGAPFDLPESRKWSELLERTTREGDSMKWKPGAD